MDRKRWLRFALIAIVLGLGTSSSLAWFFWSKGRQVEQSNARLAAQKVDRTLANFLGDYRNLLHSIAELHQNLGTLHARSLHTFYESFSRTHPSPVPTALGYARLSSDGHIDMNRPAPPISILPPSNTSHTQALVVEYSAPDQLNQPLVGHDLFQIPALRPTIERSLNQQQHGLSQIDFGTAQRPTLVLMQPAGTASREPRARSLIFCMIDIGRLAEGTLRDSDREQFHFQIRKSAYRGQAPADRILYRTADKNLHTQALLSLPLILAPQTQWQLDIFARQGTFRHYQLAAIVSLTAGLIVTGLFLGLLFQLSQKVQANQQLQRARLISERQLRFLDTLINTIPAPLYYKNTPGTYQGGNLAFAEFLGVAPEKVSGITVFDIEQWSHDEAQEIYRMDRDLLAQGLGARQRYSTRIAGPDGSQRQIILQKSTYQPPDGETPGIIGVLTDITEQRELASSLERAQHQYQMVAEHISDVIWMADTRLHITFVTPSVERLLGYRPEEFMQLDRSYWVMPASLRQVPNLHRQWLHPEGNPQASAINEIELRHRNGQGIWVEIRVTRMIANGRIVGLVGAARDITHRRRTEKYLRALSAALEQSSNPVVVTDARGTIEYVNSAFETTTGYSAAEALGKNPRILNSGTQSREFWADLWQTIRSGHSWRGDLYNRRRDGSCYWEQATISPIFDSQGEITHFVGVKEDITPRKEAEASMLRAKHSAEQANQATNTFLARISHEIRTPLTAILGMVERLEQSNLDTEQREQLDTLEHSGRHLLDMLNEVLDLAQVETDQLLLDPQPCDLAAELQHSLDEQREHAQSKDLELMLEIDPHLAPSLQADARRIRQLLRHLIGNAITYTDEGQVDIRLVVLEDQTESQQILLHIEDSGPGIPEHLQEQIFDKFSQFDPSIARQQSNMGVGLSICRHLVDLMEGRLKLQSDPDQGTCIQIELRLARVAPEDGSHLLPAIDMHPGNHLLIAEDNSVNAQIIQGFLQRRGHRTDWARNGHEALQLMQQNTYDIILMDIEMPVMNGIDATRAIRAGQAGTTHAEIPILGLSAHAMPESHNQALEAGMSDHITKPIDRVRLLEKVRSLIDSPQSSIRNTEEPEEPVQIQTDSQPPIDIAWLADQCDHETDFMADTLQDFIQSCRERIEQLQHEIDLGNHPQASQLAHALKGAAFQVGAHPLGTLAEQLELHLQYPGQAADTSPHALLQRAREQLQHIEQIVTQWRRSNS